MLLETIQLTNFLSFGENADEIALGNLNLVISPNGSGKSNLLDGTLRYLCLLAILCHPKPPPLVCDRPAGSGIGL